MHVIKRCALSVLVATTAQAQQPQTLTLACKGTAITDGKSEPVSMGIILNFTARTVQGFNYPGLMEYPVTMKGVDDVKVVFSGQKSSTISMTNSVVGSLDRVTGDLQATVGLYDEKEHKDISETTYTLQCRPAQRMF